MSGFLAHILSENPRIAAQLAADKAEVNVRPIRMATCVRTLHLSRPADAPRGETLVFTNVDSTALLKALVGEPPEGGPNLGDIASCDAKVLKTHPIRVVVELGLSVSSDRFNPGFCRLISDGFTTAKGFRLLATEAARSSVPESAVCSREPRPRRCPQPLCTAECQRRASCRLRPTLSALLVCKHAPNRCI